MSDLGDSVNLVDLFGNFNRASNIVWGFLA